MRIQHNIMAMNAYRNYNTNTSALSKNLEKLSSGYKINRAGDDAAGLAISEKMRAQITGLNAAQKNVKDGISLVKTAEGAMQEIQDMLNRMDYLATQSANGTYDDPVDRLNLQKEVNQLRSEINRIADSANFNGIKLLDGSQATANTAAWNVEAKSVLGSATPAGYDDMSSSVSANFATSADSAPAWHPGSGSGQQITVTFTVDLKGMGASISAAANATVGLSLNIGGGTQSLTVTAAGGLEAVTASDLADLMDGKEFDIQGLKFTAQADGSKVTFTMKSGETYNSTVADNLNANWDKEFTLSSTATGVTVDTNTALRHVAYDYSGAQAADGSGRAGIDFDLSQGDILKDNNKLTIDGQTFIFKVDKDTNVKGAAGEILIDVSGVGTADQVKEAVRQMTAATVNVFGSDGTTAAGHNVLVDDTRTGGHIKLSAHEGKLHLDQLDANTDIYDTPEKMHGLVKFETPKSISTTPGNVSIDLNQFQVGDRVTIGAGDAKKEYVIAEKTDADTGAITSADLVKTVADQITADVDRSKYAVSVSGTKITVTANAHGADDTQTALDALGDKLEAQAQKLGKASTAGGGLVLQIGDTSESFNQLRVNVGNMHTTSMGTMTTKKDADGNDVTVVEDSIADIDISTAEGASKAINVIKNAINYVSGIRGDLGATQNRLEHTANNLSVMAENIQDAESTIRDTDVAEEMMAYTKNNILVQSAQAMLAQANAVPQGVLQLLG